MMSTGPVEPARSRRILTIRCVACDSEVAHVLVVTDDEGKARRFLEFRSDRRMLRPNGSWRTQRAHSWFAEPLEVQPDTDSGQTLAHCRRHSHWIQHNDVLSALNAGLKVLKVVPANHPAA